MFPPSSIFILVVGSLIGSLNISYSFRFIETGILRWKQVEQSKWRHYSSPSSRGAVRKWRHERKAGVGRNRLNQWTLVFVF